MADGQVFRIEIPVEVTSKTDAGQLNQVQAIIQRTATTLERIASSGDKAFQRIASGASSAASSIQQVDTAADTIDESMDRAADSADDAAESVEEIGDAARSAGSATQSAMDGAAQSADKFGQRMEKSEKSLRKLLQEKGKLVLEAIDKISPIVKDITSKVKSLAAKAWKVTVKMVDFVTAPFKALKNMIMSPITMTLSIAGIGLGASSFYQTFADFSAGMSNVKALSGATDEEFRQLKETAADLGATTKFTASEASEGMQYLAMAGWETNQIIDAMPGLLQLAAAGATDLGTASDIVSDVMTAMGMNANEATRAADVFARTATSTNTTVAMLGETMKYAAPAAHTFGMELEDVSAIAGMMANAGIKGSSAGTALRTALLRMASPTSEAAKAMKALNISFDDGKGNMKDMKTIISDMSIAFSKLGNQEKLTYADDLFGKNASTAWLAVLEQGAGTYEKLAQSLYDSKGAAQEMADVQLDNLTGDVTLLQSAVDGMKISLMDKLDPYLRQGVQWVTSKIPQITEAIGNLIDKGIAKAKELKEHIAGVFNSADMQNADSLTDKFFVAWDKIIAEPFSAWWEGSGKTFVLSVVKKVGSTFGEVLHGVITGIFAAIKGEEIDFEGMNLTGIAQAGAEAAKEYVTSFVNGLDAGGLFAQIPGSLQAGLIGFGALKVGSGALGIAKTVGQLRLAFGGLTTTAATAATATTAAGEAAATAAAGAAGGASAFSGLGSALAAIPGWGWAALAALAAVGIGYKLYKDQQDKHREDLLNTGKAAAQMAEDYVASVRQVSEATDTIASIKEIELKIEEDKGGNQEVIDAFNTELDGLLGRTIYLTAALADDSLDAETIAAYQQELDSLHGNIVELVANLNDEGYDTAQVEIIQEQVNAIEDGETTVTLIIADKTEITPDKISEYVTHLSELMALKTTYELQIQGSGLSTDEIASYKSDLEDIQTRLSEIDVKINKGQGTMTDDEWNSLISEAASLQAQAANIQIMLQGSEMNDQEIADVKEKLGEVRGEAAGIALNIGYSENSELTQDDVNTIVDTLANIGEIKAELNIGLAEGSMGAQELEDLNKQLNETYGNLVEMSGGYFTQEDVDRGRITQERYDNWLANLESSARLDRAAFKEQVEADKGNIPELVEKRTAAQEAAGYAQSTAGDATQDFDFMQNLEGRRKDLLSSYIEGSINDEQLFTGGQQLLQDARDREWSGMAPANFLAMDPAQLFGDYTGGLFGTGLFGHWEADANVNPFGDAISVLQGQVNNRDANTDRYTAEADEANAALVQQYQNEARVVETDAFAGFGAADTKSTATIQELAASYDTLDTAGREMFANAIAGLQELNTATDYISEEEKINVGDLVDTATQSVTTAANVEVLGDVQSKLTELSTTYGTLTSEAAQADFNADNLESVNAALDALGLDKINDLSELSSKLQEISAIDPSGLSFDAAVTSLESMGGNADEAKQRVNDAKAALDALNASTADSAKSSISGVSSTASSAASNVRSVESAMTDLDGKTATVTINVQQNGSVTPHAVGGIFSAPHVGLVAEAGPEAIIPLSNSRRDRGLDLWMQAGRMLGVDAYADGGILAPYSSAFASLPDDVWDDDGNGSGDYKPPVPTGNTGNGGGNIFQVTVDVNPEYNINGSGGDPEEILEILRSHQNELAELLGSAMANQLEDIISNM